MYGEEVATGSSHADNLAPCLLGGLVLARGGGPLDVVRIPVPPTLHCVLIHPRLRVDTRDARRLLPVSIDLHDHVAQAGNLAAVIAGCYAGDLELIGRAVLARAQRPLNWVRVVPATLKSVGGFIAGFAPVAKMQGDWPLSSQAPRVLLGFAAAVLSAVGMYLSFVMVSWSWNRGTLPPEKQSLVYLMLHPAEVPPLTVQTTNRGSGEGRTRDETWHVLTIIVFFVAGVAGYMWSGRGGG